MIKDAGGGRAVVSAEPRHFWSFAERHLHAVDELAGGLGVEGAGNQATHDPLEDGAVVGGVGHARDDRARAGPGAGVEVAERLAAQGGRAAAAAVRLEVSALDRKSVV